MQEVYSEVEEMHEELYRLFNRIMMEKPEEVRKMYKQFFNWWQSIVIWNGELGVS